MELNFKQSLPYLGGFLGAVALATAAFAGGMWYRGRLIPQPEPQTQQESCKDCITPFPAPDISNWKTYRNEELGFEVKYPVGLEVIEEEFIAPPVTKLDTKQRRVKVFRFIHKEGLGLSVERYLFSVIWREDTSTYLNRLLPKEALQEILEQMRKGNYTKTRIQLKHQIAGMSGGKEIRFGSPQYTLPSSGFIQYTVGHQGNLWEFNFYIPPELYINWTDAVVSTFRFID